MGIYYDDIKKGFKVEMMGDSFATDISAQKDVKTLRPNCPLKLKYLIHKELESIRGTTKIDS